MKNQKSKIIHSASSARKNQSIKFKGLTVIFLLLASCFLLLASSVQAQLTSLGIANYLEIPTGKVEDGSIIVLSQKGYALSNAPYDATIVGVVDLNPAVSIKSDTTKKGYPVVSLGTVRTKVSGSNGTIKRGDGITTSTIPGTGMKSTDSGYVVGESLQDVSFAKSTDIKFIDVAVNPHHLQLRNQLSNSIFDIFSLSKIAAYEKPSKALQYILAAIIIILSFGIGFLIFSKVVSKGIEAMGRNPLAGRMIQLSIVFNVLLIAIIVIAGTALAYLVIRL